MECAEGVVVAGRYRLVRKLGAGGMGSVWLTHDISLDSSCALKLIDEEKSQSNEVRLRFEREAKAAAQLRGAHVVDVFDHGEWENVLYIAMEYLEGEDLGARLDREGALEPAVAYRIVAHVARALTRAHAHGIVHRDLKPENVFLVQSDEGEIAKVLDFGIAKHDAYSLQGKATRTGSFLGTPYYVSPEQARGKSTDHRSDLWSLGIIAFQCLTGRPPFESDALGELMGLILYEDLPRITLKNPRLPLAMDAWWERAAARDRELRFQSAKELADSLAVALGISRPLAVQSVAPRRQSYSDVTGQFPAARVDLSPPALPTMPRSQLSASHDALGDSLEELVETDAPVSRTRHSGFVLSSALRWPERLPLWFSRLKEQRKRTLVTAAVGGGVALGVILTLVLVGGGDHADGAPAELSPPPRAARPAATPAVEAAKPEAPTASSATSQPSIPIEALPSVQSDETDADREDARKEEGTAAEPPSSEPKRRAPPPPRRPKRPDYGI